MFAKICRGAQSQFRELELCLRDSGHGDLLGADGVELYHDNNDRVEGGDEHEDEVEDDEKLKISPSKNIVQGV